VPLGLEDLLSLFGFCDWCFDAVGVGELRVVVLSWFDPPEPATAIAVPASTTTTAADVVAYTARRRRRICWPRAMTWVMASPPCIGGEGSSR
jgi:hypothetical protein